MKVELICKFCKTKFLREKKSLRKNNKNQFCSQKCASSFRDLKQTMICPICNNEFRRAPYGLKESKSGKFFCSRSCAVTYNNTHKTKGIRVSKLELWLQQKLLEIYPELKFHFNRKDAINSELDIYIPSLKLAFELNGIFHYEPIFGEDKLNQIQNNDNRKFAACSENNISLCVINISMLKNFKEQKAIIYLNIVKEIIDINLVNV